MTSTEGLTATCAAALELPNLQGLSSYYYSYTRESMTKPKIMVYLFILEFYVFGVQFRIQIYFSFFTTVITRLSKSGSPLRELHSS